MEHIYCNGLDYKSIKCASGRIFINFKAVIYLLKHSENVRNREELYREANKLNSTKTKNEDIYKNLGAPAYLKNTSKLEFFSLLKDVLDALDIDLELDKPCLKYTLDGYLLQVNAVIEFDGDDDEQRELAIKKELGCWCDCVFIKLSPKMSHGYNVGKVIYHIY